jgi:NMD protein affecting ribosome stability and mRNA decay
MWLLAMICGFALGMAVQRLTLHYKLEYMRRILNVREDQIIERDKTLWEMRKRIMNYEALDNAKNNPYI